MSTPPARNPDRPAWLAPLYALALVLGVFVYFYGLGSDHIPKNGDEFPYAHLTRLTAASGHLLPLKSDIESLRNTKPPLIFWQGIVSTNWAKNWTLVNLRYPSVFCTLLTAALIYLVTARLSGARDKAVLAALIFLAFFSTYRYGRPFLTDPPVVFWLFVPFAVLLLRPAVFDSRLAAPLAFGVVIGIGLLYKSFALLLPEMAGLGWWYWRRRDYSIKEFVLRDSWKLAAMGVVALAVFGLWFALDPDPRAIIREFVLGENVAKFDSHGGGYLAKLLWGGSSIWSLAAGYLVDAGLLALPVLGLFVIAVKYRKEMAPSERLLWFWIVTLFLVFSLPSQRSERYLLPAMPALAILCALNWERIARWWFAVSLAAAGLAVAVVGYLSLRLQQGMPGPALYSAGHWLLLSGTVVFVAVALWRPALTRPGLVVVAFLACLCFSSFLRPFDGALGNYGAEAQAFARGRDVWVPVNFKAKEEGYLFLLPGAKPHPYSYDRSLTATNLAAKYPLFAIRLPISDTNPVAGRVIGERLELGSRHSSAQIKEMIQGKVYEHLFLKELLIESPDAATLTPPPDGKR
jgi:4-amino-4-deoxy-L-arabinose transferase-like glycosyltransferase